MREHSLMIQSMLYCLHLGMRSFRASDYAIFGLTVICARISDCLFSDWLPVNSNKFAGIVADPYHSLSRFVPAFSDTAQDWSIMFSSPAAVRHGLSCNWQAVWSQYSLFPDKMRSPTLFMCTDPWGLQNQRPYSCGTCTSPEKFNLDAGHQNSQKPWDLDEPQNTYVFGFTRKLLIFDGWENRVFWSFMGCMGRLWVFNW